MGLTCVAVVLLTVVTGGAPAIDVKTLSGPDCVVSASVASTLQDAFTALAAPAGSATTGTDASRSARYQLKGSCVRVDKHLLINLSVVDQKCGKPIPGTAAYMLIPEEDLSAVVARTASRISSSVNDYDSQHRAAASAVVYAEHRSPVKPRYASTGASSRSNAGASTS